MTVEHVEVLVEEPSMETALRVLLPRMLGNVSVAIHTHQGKSNLLQRLPDRLRAYSRWLPANWRIVVVVDRDDDDCEQLKRQLESMASKAGLATRARAKGGPYRAVTRLAIEELEAWYFGDWRAVRAAYPRAPATVPKQARFRRPDRIKGGTWEAFERVLQDAGYFTGGLRKIEAAREVARHMEPARNTSPSFRALRAVLAELAPA